jgi:hypothetical protein
MCTVQTFCMETLLSRRHFVEETFSMCANKKGIRYYCIDNFHTLVTTVFSKLYLQRDFLLSMAKSYQVYKKNYNKTITYCFAKIKKMYKFI